MTNKLFIAILLFILPLFIINSKCNNKNKDEDSAFTCNMIQSGGTCNVYSGSLELVSLARDLCSAFGSKTESYPAENLIGKCTVEKKNPSGTIIVNYYSPVYKNHAAAKADCSNQNGVYSKNI